MATKATHKGKVKLGQVTVAEIGTWTGGEINRVMLQAGALGDDFEKYEYGRISGGLVSFSGWFDPADTTGQIALRTAFDNETELDDLRLYFGEGTTDFLVLGQNTKALVESCGDVTADANASGLCPTNFTLRISNGVLVRCTAFYEAATIAFAEGGTTDTITDEANGFVTAGFTAAMGLIVEGSTSNDQRALTIAAGGVAQGVLTLTATTDDLVAEVKGDTVSLIGYTKLTY